MQAPELSAVEVEQSRQFRFMIAAGISLLLIALFGGAAIFYRAAQAEDLRDLRHAARALAANVALLLEQEAAPPGVNRDPAIFLESAIALRGVSEAAIWMPARGPGVALKRKDGSIAVSSAHPDALLQGALERALAGQSGAEQLRREEGGSVLVGFAPIPPEQGAIVLKMDLTEGHAYYGALAWIAGLGVTLVAAGLAAFFVLVQRPAALLSQLRSNAALRQSETVLRALAEKVDHVMWLASRDRMLYVNPAYEKVFGRKLADLYADRKEFAYACVPEDRGRVISAMQRVYTEGVDFNEEYRIVTPSGEMKWIWARTFAFRAGGTGELQSVGMAQDITMRKHAELAARDRSAELETRVAERTAELEEANARLLEDIQARHALTRSLIDLKKAIDAHSIVAVTDTRGKITYANENFSRISGYSREELIGQDHRLINSGHHPREFMKNLWDTIKSGQVWRGEIRNRARNGSLYWVDTTIVPLLGENGQAVQFISIRTEITARKHAESQLQAAKEMAEAANAAKSEFLANMSHEIRTPMHGIIGMVSLLAQTATAEQQQYLRLIHSSGKNLMRLINEILDLSKIEANRMEMERLDFDLRRLVRDTYDALSTQAMEKGLQFRCDVEDSVPAVVTGDSARIRQILINLIANAIKFTQSGLVRLHVSMDRGDGRSCLIRFSVTDTGIGIHETQLERIFDPFTQADGSTTRRFGGTGLGLAICRQLAELMGGTIGVESTPEMGSCFWVILPLGIPEAPGRFPGESPPLSAALEGKPLALRVLLAEDEPISQLVTRAMLEKLGCEVVTASSGLEVVRALEAADFDVVFDGCDDAGNERI